MVCMGNFRFSAQKLRIGFPYGNVDFQALFRGRDGTAVFFLQGSRPNPELIYDHNSVDRNCLRAVVRLSGS